MKRKTRKQKMKDRPQGPTGQSKYALKVARRKRKAVSLGLPENTPYPAIVSYLERWELNYDQETYSRIR